MQLNSIKRICIFINSFTALGNLNNIKIFFLKMNLFKGITKAIIDTFYWFIGNAVYSIFPLILLFFMKKLGANDDNLDQELYALLQGGIIIFFFCSLMGTISIDLIISGELDNLPRRRKLLFKFVLIQVPFIILFSLILVYLLIIFKFLPRPNTNNQN